MMSMNTTPRTTAPYAAALKALCAVCVMSGASLLPSVALAVDNSSTAPKATTQGVQAQYAKDRAACMGGKTNQDQATCLREAGAARDEAMKGVLDNDGADATAMQRNALDRCKAQPAADQAACRARVTGGSTSGSVQGGGVLRQATEVVPAAVKPAVSPGPAATK